jgi:hypothetical protein
MWQFLQNLAVFRKKITPNFSSNFLAKNFKNHNIGPWNDHIAAKKGKFSFA